MVALGAVHGRSVAGLPLLTSPGSDRPVSGVRSDRADREFGRSYLQSDYVDVNADAALC